MKSRSAGRISDSDDNSLDQSFTLSWSRTVIDSAPRAAKGRRQHPKTKGLNVHLVMVRAALIEAE